METSRSERVLVTGASGYIASHCVQQLLLAGYKVRGSVRNIKDSKKVDFLYKIVPERKDNIELVQADLLDKESWVNATKNCTYILHVASPALLDVKKEEIVIKPAVEGTLNVLDAALKNGVKKVVITSSVAAIWVGHADEEFDENTWSIESKCGAYEKSKLLAERAAWDFWRRHY